MTEYTPGPWECISGNEIYSKKSQTNTPIAKIFKRLQPGETEANAALIASAPDLLQELRNIANADTAEWDDRAEFEVWAKSRARAAIAKATRRSA